MFRYSRSSNQSSFRADRPLTDEEIGRYAPSVFATQPHESRKQSYSMIPTSAVLAGLRAEGFQPFEVRQTRCRDLAKRDYTKHMLRFRHANAIVAQEVPEIVLLNSHDGTSSYQLLAGVFRMVCSNGLIAGDVCNDIRIRHSGNVVNDVIEGSYTVLDNLQQVESRIGSYKAITLERPEKLALAEAVREVRWGDEAPVMAESLLIPRRYDDRKDDLWTVANVLQESVIRGGVRGRAATGRRMHTREVNGVTENVRLNRAIWTLTDRLAQIKLAA